MIPNIHFHSKRFIVSIEDGGGQRASIGRPLAISDSEINAEGLMSRASKPGSANDTTLAGMMHRSEIFMRH